MKKSTNKSNDPKAAHDEFIRKVSEKTSISDFVSKIVGIDPIPLGPNVLDPNLDSEHPYPLDSYQLCLYPPFAVSDHFGSKMFMEMCRYLEEGFGIQFSQVPLVNASLQRFFPDGYEEAAYEKELNQARELENHLLPSRLHEIELAHNESTEPPIITDYREILTPERRSSAAYYLKLIERMQGPNNNNGR
jgi:hypothetical protein